jgi:hypothetical protein
VVRHATPTLGEGDTFEQSVIGFQVASVHSIALLPAIRYASYALQAAAEGGAGRRA